MLYLRDEVAEAQLSALKAESERRYLIFALQSALLENHKVSYISIKDDLIFYIGVRDIPFI